MSASPKSVVSALAMTLASLSSDFAENELAYLALTSKAELPVRDRIAWRLQHELNDSYVVSREWRRADIAVLAGETPVLQVEAKAMYAFDVLNAKSRAKNLAKLTADGLKMAALAPDSAAYLLALITHVDGSVPLHLRRHVVKHSGGIVASLTKEGTAGAVGARARQLWEADLARFTSPSTRFGIAGGTMWGLTVELDAYLIGPLSKA
ncbi:MULTISPECIES: hypothetical protein [unclassified Nocardioides]|uniref:hypothetical protein n=1 Tax=unclassified Nocardioides TaxID=2615069 RepID=UPI0036151E94